MRERTSELREIIGMKDAAMKKLRRTVDDQTLLIQSLRFNSADDTEHRGQKKVSIMSEISEYVRTRADDDARPPSEEHNDPTADGANDAGGVEGDPDFNLAEPRILSPLINMDDLGARMSFYASALQQVAKGKQLVTRESAKGMSLERLQRIATVLEELVTFKSEQLLQAFQVCQLHAFVIPHSPSQRGCGLQWYAH
jgi:hypothetical protein